MIALKLQRATKAHEMQLDGYNRLNISKELPLEFSGSIIHKPRRIYVMDQNSCFGAILSRQDLALKSW